MSILMLNAQETRNFIDEHAAHKCRRKLKNIVPICFLVIRRRWLNINESLKGLSKDRVIVLISPVPETKIVMLN